MMRGNLFIKVFIAFWVVTCAILGSWMLTADYFEQRPNHGVAGGPNPTAPPHRFLLRTIYELQNQERERLPQIIARAKKRHQIDIYLVAGSGEELLGRELPPAVQALARELDGRRRRAFGGSAEGRLVGHEIYRRDTGNLKAIFLFGKPPGGLLPLLGGNPLLRILLAVVISGLICYLLSRFLTRRLEALRSASRRLANGELDTRIRVRERGGDETDELARDFNSMAQQLQDRVQAQKRLLGDVSHELRSPLARLRIALALAQEDASGREGHLERIEREAQRLEELIAQLLASESDSIEFDAHVDLLPMLEGLCEDARFEGRARGVGVNFHTTIPSAIVNSSGDLLHKCFENILRNALAHTADDTAVSVSLSAEGASFLVTLEDCGPGVPDEELERIFDTFYRVDTSRTRASGGYGLGLSIARRAVLQHGGTIAAHNTENGLKIRVSLPAETG